ncbi:kinase domain protein (macronuclear) [Tetrahymena thermophila SB210]|uniref:mitogen-activated protein kinase kinase n=1 Tax=Tetrahymena thermophila (strain SB210) TaxID=312017 RepID=A4VEF9_TETTS|nr:kinase domain protein [Tetrahymena thermophila SB210]EDK31901.2 kinase domain protein [Tetrahymena thermophila SB210]|eukprot:XP_001471213.2 kinase domain protein [Tetrahymena thermophila SB210]
MKDLLLIIFIILSSCQAQYLESPQLEYFLNNIEFANQGQFFYDNNLDLAIIIQPDKEQDQIKLYRNFTTNKYEHPKQLTVKNLPQKYDKFVFIPEIQQILYASSNQTSNIQQISSISYRDNQLIISESQTRIKSVLSIEYQPITNIIVNIFICGLDNKSNYQIEVWQINQLGEIKHFESLIKVEKNILKTFSNIYKKNNIDQQFSQKRYSIIYLSYLLESSLLSQFSKQQYLNLFKNQTLSILDAEIFYLRKNNDQNNVTANHLINKSNIFGDLMTLNSTKLKKGLTKSSKKIKLDQQQLQSNLSYANQLAPQNFTLIKSEIKVFGQNNNYYEAEKELFNDKNINEYDRIICLIIQEDINKDQQFRKLLKCQSKLESLQISMQLDLFQQLISDPQNSRIISIQPYQSGKTKITLYDLQKLEEQDKIISMQDIQSQVDCIVFYNFQQEKPKILNLNENILLMQESLNNYYQCNTKSGLATRNKTPDNWKQLLLSNDYKVFQRKNSNSTLIIFTNQQSKRFILAEGKQRKMADINHYGLKILNMIPLFVTIGLFLFIILRLNNYRKVQRKLSAQISTFKSTFITYYQFKLRYMKREDFMRSRYSFYFNQVAREHQNNGYEIYVDQFNHNKAYLVKVIKIQSFQNQDYVQEYINTHLQLSKYEGVVKLLHYCIIPEQMAYIITDVPNKTLQSQIEQQIAILEQFDDKIILKIAQEVINCLLLIQKELDLPHRDIKPSSIVLASDGQYKLTNFRPSQFNLASNYMLILSQGSIAFMSPEVRFQIEVQMSNVNYDPEEEEVGQSYEIYKKSLDQNINVLDYIKNEEEIHLYDQYKADIFSLGLTLLLATTKMGIDGLNINKELLSERILKLKSNTNFSDKTKDLIESMLKWEEDERPTYEQLLSMIQE